MLEMTWDDELADEAQKWADNCEFAYNPKHYTHHYDFVGQNLYASDQLEDIVQNAMKAWCTKERETYNRDSSCIQSNTKMCNRYAQVSYNLISIMDDNSFLKGHTLGVSIGNCSQSYFHVLGYLVQKL